MNTLFKYFLTIKNISINSLKNNSYIKPILTKKTSILEEFKKDLIEYIEKNNISDKNIKDNIGLETISNHFTNYLIINKDIKLFFEFFIEYKNLIENNILSITEFKKIVNSITSRNLYLELDSNKYIISNPLDYSYVQLFDLEKYKMDILDYNKNENILKAIDILTQGSIINLTLPSVGIIYNKETLKLKNCNSYVKLIKTLIDTKENYGEINKNIPLKEMELGNIITEILFTTNNYVLTNSKIKVLFKSMIDNINVDLDEILFNKTKINNKTIKKIKPKYIIPYKNEIKKNTQEDIFLISTIELDKIKTIKDLFEKNNSILSYVLKKITENIDENIKNSYKNVLASYLFFIIGLLNDIIFDYVDKIDDIFKNIIESKDKRYGYLNIKGVFQFTSSLKKSVRKFKLLLLNNFYYLFEPSSITNGNYGFQLTNYNYYVPEGIFQNNNILNYFPFEYVLSTHEIICNEEKCKGFILNTKGKYDLYYTDELIELGGLCFNNDIVETSLNNLLYTYNDFEKMDQLNLFIINKLIDNWTISKKIPYELLDNIIPISNTNKVLYERTILRAYEDNIKKAIYNVKFVLKERNKQFNLNKIDDKTTNKIIYHLICYNLYYIISIYLINYVKNSKLDIGLKNKIIEKMNMKKIELTNMIQK